MASGANGGNGNHVQERVELPDNNVYGHVPGHAQLLVAETALVTVEKLKLAKQELVQVNACFREVGWRSLRQYVPCSYPVVDTTFWSSFFLALSIALHPSPTHPPPYKKSKFQFKRNISMVEIKSCKSCHISLHKFLNLAFIVERFHSLNNYLRSRLQSVETTRYPKLCVDSIPFCFLSIVDGDWSNWNKWTTCSKTCGEGTQIRIRTCDDPKPLHGGKQCEGAAQEARVCNTRKCPGMFLKIF